MADALATLLEWVELATAQIATEGKVVTYRLNASDRPWGVPASLHCTVRPSLATKLLEEKRPHKVDPDLPASFRTLANRVADVSEEARKLAQSSRHPAAFMIAHTLKHVVAAADAYLAARGAGMEVSAETLRWGFDGEHAGTAVVLTMHPEKGEPDAVRARHRAFVELYEGSPSLFSGGEPQREKWLAECRRRATRILNDRGLNGAALMRAANKVREKNIEARKRADGAGK